MNYSHPQHIRSTPSPTSSPFSFSPPSLSKNPIPPFSFSVSSAALEAAADGDGGEAVEASFYFSKPVDPHPSTNTSSLPSSFLHAFASPTLTIFVFLPPPPLFFKFRRCSRRFPAAWVPKNRTLSSLRLSLTLLRSSSTSSLFFSFRRTSGGRQWENGKVPSFLEPLELYFLYC